MCKLASILVNNSEQFCKTSEEATVLMKEWYHSSLTILYRDVQFLVWHRLLNKLGKTVQRKMQHSPVHHSGKKSAAVLPPNWNNNIMIIIKITNIIIIFIAVVIVVYIKT